MGLVSSALHTAATVAPFVRSQPESHVQQSILIQPQQLPPSSQLLPLLRWWRRRVAIFWA